VSDTYDLQLAQGETFRRTFSYADDAVVGSFLDFDIKAEVRQKESVTAKLALALTPLFTVSEDGATATLVIPATATAALDATLFKASGAFWDMFLVDKNDPDNAELFMEGKAYLNPATTQTVVS